MAVHWRDDRSAEELDQDVRACTAKSRSCDRGAAEGHLDRDNHRRRASLPRACKLSARARDDEAVTDRNCDRSCRRTVGDIDPGPERYRESAGRPVGRKEKARKKAASAAASLPRRPVKKNGPLNPAQFDVLDWIANGCPPAAGEDSPRRLSARALHNRGLVTVHADSIDPLNGRLKEIAKVTKASHEELEPFMNGWSTQGPYR